MQTSDENVITDFLYLYEESYRKSTEFPREPRDDRDYRNAFTKMPQDLSSNLKEDSG